MLATLATILYFGGSLEECIVPGGENVSAVVKVDLITLPLFLSKVRIDCVLVDACND